MNSALFFAGLRDDEIAEIDQGDTSDLSAVYYLLRRNPALVE
jgi:hypothetical protein